MQLKVWPQNLLIEALLIEGSSSLSLSIPWGSKPWESIGALLFPWAVVLGETVVTCFRAGGMEIELGQRWGPRNLRDVDTEPTRNGGIFVQLNISKSMGEKKVLYWELWTWTSGCVMLDRSLNLPDPPFPQLQNEKNTSYFIGSAHPQKYLVKMGHLHGSVS